LSLITVVASLLVSPAASAKPRCRGTKISYAGKCLYPKEVQALKRARAAKSVATGQKKQAAAKKRADKLEADRRSCARARKMQSIDGWKMYLDAFPEGSCRADAETQMKAIAARPAAEPAAPPTPPVATPAAAPPSVPARDKAPPVEPAPAAEIPQPLAPVPAAADAPSEAPSGRSPLVYIGFGTAAAGVIVGGITGGLSFSQSKDLQGRCDNGACAPELQGEIDSMSTLGTISTVSFAVAGAGAALGIVGLAMGPSSAPAADDGGDAGAGASWQLRITASGARLRLRF
jgi:hypothetical protein